MTQPPSDSPPWLLKAWKRAEELADPCEHPGDVILSALERHEPELSQDTAELNEKQQEVRQRLNLE